MKKIMLSLLVFTCLCQGTCNHVHTPECGNEYEHCSHEISIEPLDDIDPVKPPRE